MDLINLKYRIGQILIGMLCLILFSSAAHAKNKKELTIAADVWCPISCNPEEGDPGIGVDLAKRVFAPLGYEINYIIMPWSEALAKVRLGDVDAVVGANASDDPKLLFPETSLYMISDDFYVLKDKNWKYTDMESLEGRRLGIIKDYGYNEALKKFIESHRNVPNSLHEAEGNDALPKNIEALLSGKIDIVVESRAIMDYRLKKTGLGEKIKWAGSIPQGHVYLAFSPAIEHAKERVKQFDDGVEKLKAKGKYLGLYDHYGMTQGLKY